MNAAAMIKLMGAKKNFEKNHPKFSVFVKRMLAPIRANIKVQASDLELLRGLKEMSESEGS